MIRFLAFCKSGSQSSVTRIQEKKQKKKKENKLNELIIIKTKINL